MGKVGESPNLPAALPIRIRRLSVRVYPIACLPPLNAGDYRTRQGRELNVVEIFGVFVESHFWHGCMSDGNLTDTTVGPFADQY